MPHMNVVMSRQNCRLLAMHTSVNVSTCPHLLFVEDSSKAVEELKGREDLALYQHAGDYCRCCPPSRAHRHLEEPLLQRYSASFSTQYCSHVGWSFLASRAVRMVWWRDL